MAYFIVKGIAVQGARLLGIGDRVGDVALTTPARHLLDVRALTYVQCWALDRRDLWRVLESGNFPVSYATCRE